MGYEYNGSRRGAVGKAFTTLISDWQLSQTRYRLASDGALSLDTTPRAGVVADIDLGDGPRWLADHVFWATLRCDFDVLEGPLGVGVLVRWSGGLLIGVAIEHSIADGNSAERLFARLGDALITELGSDERFAGAASPRRRSVARPALRGDEASAALPVELAAADVVRSMAGAVEFCSPGDHRSRLSTSWKIPVEDVDRAAATLGVSQFTLVLGAYGLALMEMTGRGEVFVVTPVSSRLLSSDYTFGVARMVPIWLRTPASGLASWLRGLQQQIGMALVTDISLNQILVDAGCQDRVPWAFLGWEKVVIDLDGFHPWTPSERQDVVVRPGVGLHVVVGTDEFTLTLRLQQSAANEEVIGTLVEVLRKTMRDVLAAGVCLGSTSQPVSGTTDEKRD